MALARRNRPQLVVARSVAGDTFMVAPELLIACRAASLRIEAQRLTSLGVTSTMRGEGRTTIAMALALIQAYDYRRGVILIEMDLENPSLADRFGLHARPGLMELAEGRASIGETVQALADGIGVITAGGPAWSTSKAAVAVTSSGILQAVAQETDIVIADLPPLTGSLGHEWTDALQQLVYVVRARITPLANVRDAVATLSPEPALVLNGTDVNLPHWLRVILGQ